ncbi:hypothetical protein [Thorsellia kenyensis]|uniref:DUF115 domain-containing protein n=1 Tax=Thorsellia kenyensis TaxID=1549888 RepID=A0ABV6C9G8_9GAMM
MRNNIYKLTTKILKTLSLYILLLPLYLKYLISNGIKIKTIKLYKTKKNIIVIGNGPSLTNDVDFIYSNIGSADFISVNHFAENEIFFKIKPQKYILLDNYFWNEKADRKLVERREYLFEILNRITWEMQLLLPINSNVKYIEKKISNSNVKILPFKLIDISAIGLYLNIQIAAKLYSNKIITPPSCNVLIYAVYFSVLAKYEKIYIVGADLSFHNDVSVNQITNDVEITYRHFYGNSEKVILFKNPEREKKMTMLELMDTTYLTYYGHYSLAIFALNNGCEIINKSSFSMIDSYKRI